ncbi:hypothetical protein Tco_0195114 [Tanacetum coccineum]
MSNTNTNLQTQTSDALHNAIMEAGGKDCPPMLARESTLQIWTEKTVLVTEGSSETSTEGYIENYKNVSQDIRNQLDVEAEVVQIILTGIDNDIYSTINACSNACEMWKVIERLKQGESINVKDLETNLYWEFGKFTSRDGASLELYYSRFYKMMDELVRNQCDVTNHQVNVQFLRKAIINSPPPTYDQGPTMVAEDDEMSKENKIDKLMALISLSFKKTYKPTNNNLRTSSNTSRANQDNTLRINKGTVGSGYQQKDRKPSQNDKTEHGMEKTVQNQGQIVKCERLEKELSKSKTVSKSFEALQKHAINLEIALQQCKEQIKNDKAFKENQFFKVKSVTTINVSNDFSKPITAQILPHNMMSLLKNTNVIAPGMYNMHTKPNQTRTPQLLQDIRKTNKCVSFSTGVIPTTSVSRPQLKSNLLEDRVMHNDSQGKKQQVDDHRRNFKFSNNKTFVTACNDSLNSKTSNVNFVCVTCGKCVLNDNHDMCVLHYINGVNSRTKCPWLCLLVLENLNEL